MFKYIFLLVALSVAASNGIRVSDPVFLFVAVVTVCKAARDVIIWLVAFNTASKKLKEVVHG